jgi:alkaline phosphatase
MTREGPGRRRVGHRGDRLLSLAAFVEKFVPFLPSVPFYLAVGASVQDAEGLVPAVLAAWMGSFAGSLAWYFAGYAVPAAASRSMSALAARWLRLPPDSWDRARGAFLRNAFLAVALGHVVPSVRMVIGLPAGVFRMPLPAFAAAAAIGTLSWIGPLMRAGALLRGTHGW